jgi:putative ABC transport system ATP-binding protein
VVEPVIETQGLEKEYGLGAHVVQALRGVSVTIEAGELVAIMGPSGSGKSTLMSILGCLDTPTAGRYLLEGQDVSQLDDDVVELVAALDIPFSRAGRSQRAPPSRTGDRREQGGG